MGEGFGDGNHAQVIHFLILSLTRTNLGVFRIITRMQPLQLRSRQTVAAARAYSSFTLLISPHKHLVTSYLALLFVSTQMQGVGVLVNDTLPHSNSHSLESVAGMLATAVNGRDDRH